MVCMQRELSRLPTFFNYVPDACLFGLGGLAFVVAWLWPSAIVLPTVLRWVGVAMIGMALMLITATMNTLRRARTSTNPIDAPSQLLVAGPFSWSRNPLYVAYVVALCGCALASGSWLALGCPLLGVCCAEWADYSDRGAAHGRGIWRRLSTLLPAGAQVVVKRYWFSPKLW